MHPARSNPSAPPLRLIALAMAAGLVALVAAAILLRPRTAGWLPPFVVWTVAALALGNLLVGTVLAITADRGSRGFTTRIVVSLALREVAGLLGAILTLLGGEPAWALGLGGTAIVALLAGTRAEAAGL